jgi:hypothetical protein
VAVIFIDKINLSNTTSTDSVDARISANGSNKDGTWWECDHAVDEPIVRISTDNGLRFGPH